MASEEQMTEYEQQRQENIKRNGEMMSSLSIHSLLSNLSSPAKRPRAYIKKNYEQTRRSLRAQGIPPDHPTSLPDDSDDLKPSNSNSSKPMSEIGPLTMSDAYLGDLDSHRIFLGSFGGLKRSSVDHFKRMTVEQAVNIESFKLESENVTCVMPQELLVVRFFPTSDITMLVAGNRSGQLAFWDVKPRDGKENHQVMHVYQPHFAGISGISVHPFSLSKMYSSSYDGILRLMNIEREEFDLVYSSSSRCGLFSVSQQPNDANCIYVGEGVGNLNLIDGRVGKMSNSWSLHEGRIHSIDFDPANTNVIATSSADGLVCMWDRRKMDVRQPDYKAFWTVNHERAVHSAYFSPSGSSLATTSLGENVSVHSGVNFEDMSIIHRRSCSHRSWQSSSRAVWGWDDAYLYMGYMKRRVNVLSVTEAKVVHTLESSLISAIPCILDAHPCAVGMLAGATASGKAYVWTAF